MNHFDVIINEIRRREEIFFSSNAIASCAILRHLIELIGEEGFNQKFDMYFLNKEYDFNTSFTEFHKSMRQNDFYEIGEGHLDMIFWNYIHISNKCYDIFKEYYDFITPRLDEITELNKNIGKRVEKCTITGKEENGKPFKSGAKINTVKDIIIHPILEIFAYTFHEDNSYVECRRCKVVEEIN